jgi:UDP-4-amino-4,6-dideoxy-N-acetyl-beta-L-altrosamine transaminase
MKTRIPYGRQSISDEDIDAVVAVLRSDWLTQGPAVPAFEKAVAARVKSNFAVAVNSATAALHLACLALEVGSNDIVWTVPNTFVASANCARYCGAAVDFVDIDPDTLCMSVTALADKLDAQRSMGKPLPKVVIPVHFGGQSCDMEGIASLGQRYGFRIIEDASHAIGASYLDEPVGCGKFSDITVFSFHPVKIITTGEGGMALTNDVTLSERMRRLRSHGITREASEMTMLPPASWYYEQQALGFNYRLTDMQAALGLSQLDLLAAFVERRHQIAAQYDSAFSSLPVRVQRVPDAMVSARHLYVIRVDPQNRDDLFKALQSAGIGVNVHYFPVHLQPYYRALGFAAGDYPHAERYASEAISLPVFPELTAQEQHFVISTLSRELMARMGEAA